MKKLTKKLLLSAITLGLALVTLTTTTFAWYTSSTTATVAGGSSTSGTTSDSTLLISKDYDSSNPETATWGKSVSFDSLGTSLIPVQWDATKGKFTYLEGGDAANTDYYQFTIYFKTSKTFTTGATSIPVYLKSLTLTNGGALPQYDNL